jgi:hypothetical protein
VEIDKVEELIRDAAKSASQDIFKRWKGAEPGELEALHAEARALDKLTFRIINTIRGIGNG